MIKLGDRVRVVELVGKTTELYGAIGIVRVCPHPYYTHLIGVEFSLKLPFLHNLDGFLDKDQGYWVYDENLKKIIEPTGFSQFIKRIECSNLS